ncbi:hypothetical protein HWV62_44227 [Athelia sp. TMB]|nr:hypothetical protein HWV62_44227 [Athelia sp. TMB]
MSRQDKATTERNTKMLRELVKRPENKVCADCKRNDPRWASWNIGVYLCIRCSGIHRGMGTHISKVKSIDLDTWTPEQMQSIEKWGNKRANMYWEAHLKSGHVPPDHKMESFIRSKYETRRWAQEGPPPADPSILDDSAPVSEPAPAQAPAQATTSTGFSRANATATPPITRQPQPHQLLSTAISDQRRQVPPLTPPTGTPAPAAAAAPAPQAPENDLFSLDFHAPPPSTSQTQQQGQGQSKNVKQDILSLFSTPAAAPAAAPANNAFGSFQSASPWDAAPAQQQQQPTSMMGATGWGASSGGWGAPAAPAAPAPANIWGAPAAPQQPDLFGANDIWGSNVGGGAAVGSANIWGSSGGSAPAQQQQQKKDDAFGDIWGGFK